MGARSSEVAGEFLHRAELWRPISIPVGSREGKAVWAVVSTAVYAFEQKPSCRMHFDHSWRPHGKFSSVNS